MTGADRGEEPGLFGEMGTGLGAASSAGALEADVRDTLPSGGLSQGGLSWSWDLDVAALLDATSEPAPWARDARKPASGSATSAEGEGTDSASDQDAELAEILDAMDAGRSRVVPLATVAGRIAESVPTGPELAGWMASGSVASLEDGALAGMAASYRRLASWAQAGELAVVAELAARSAAADSKIGVDEQGCPARLPDEASAQVSLALTMSQCSASWWADLAITLRWRLAATWAALQSGAIDLGRARVIAEATAMLDKETARAVEARVLPAAGDQTMGQLRAALRRAVIAADPKGADERREEAERRAKVALYPDAEGTAALAGYSLPGVRAAAAMARISALARALKASGAGGGIDLLRAQVFLGLLLGTLPYIPPAPDGLPDGEPPDEGPPDESPPPDGEARARAPADCPGRDDVQRGGGGGGDLGSRRARADQDRGGGDQGAESDRDLGGGGDRDQGGGDRGGGDRGGGGSQVEGDDDDGLVARPPPAWPEVPAFLQPGPAALKHLRPAGGGLLDLRLPWTTLIEQSSEPGYLGRLGPITPSQAGYLANLAARDRSVDWRVVVVGPDGQAVGVTRVLRKSAVGPDSTSVGSRIDDQLVGRVTITIAQDCLSGPSPMQARIPSAGDPLLDRVLAAAKRAADRAAERAAADAETADGCAHVEASVAYRPPPRLWEYVTARDLTCRFGTCRQPACRCDLDHTKPYDQGGRTCACNLGGVCRFHHQIKQHRGWRLVQLMPGTFTWTTPMGRSYITGPDSHAA
jgi:hypothetical protein